MKPVEQALVDDRSPNGLPKKPSCDEAGSSTEQSADNHERFFYEEEVRLIIRLGYELLRRLNLGYQPPFVKLPNLPGHPNYTKLYKFSTVVP